MAIMTEDSVVLSKTRELCQTILEQPDVRSIRQRIDAFMADESSRGQYEGVVAKGQALQDKQQQSMPLSSEEINDFEEQRDALLRNPVAKGFLEAQEELHEMKHSIQQYVNRTLELGRVPTHDDLNSCGHGCSCGH
jgi:cell fate (sporulation/competence/biofilm development) regulator YlbF (YheA/YmcA/DUF963 family)